MAKHGNHSKTNPKKEERHRQQQHSKAAKKKVMIPHKKGLVGVKQHTKRREGVVSTIVESSVPSSKNKTKATKPNKQKPTPPPWFVGVPLFDEEGGSDTDLERLKVVASATNKSKRTNKNAIATCKKNTKKKKDDEQPPEPTFRELVQFFKDRMLHEQGPILEQLERKNALQQSRLVPLLLEPHIHLRAILELRYDSAATLKRIVGIREGHAYRSFSERVVPLVQRYLQELVKVGGRANTSSLVEPAAAAATNYPQPHNATTEGDSGGDEQELCHEELQPPQEDDDYDEEDPYGGGGDDDEGGLLLGGSSSSSSQQPPQYLQATEEALLEKKFSRRLRRMMDPDSVLPMFIQRDECLHCRVEMLKMQNSSQLVCPKCDYCTDLSVSTTESLPFGEEVDVSDNMYDRNEYYARFLRQYREDAELVCADVIARVDAYIRQHHDISVDKITAALVGKVLRHLDLRQYEAQSDSICNGLLNIPIARFSEFQYQRLLWRFKQEQRPYQQVKDRPNYGSFKYNTNKNLRMDGWDYFCVGFPLPTTEDVIKKLDAVKKKVCDILQSRRKHASDPMWIFYPS